MRHLLRDESYLPGHLGHQVGVHAAFPGCGFEL